MVEKSANRTALPTPAENPSAEAVVIFDGHCRFCHTNVKQLARWDGKQRLAFLSLHEAEQVAQIAPQLTHEQMMEQLYVVTDQGTTYGGAAGLRRLSRLLPRLWVLAPLLHLPFTLPFWQWAYGLIARQRYRIAGKQESCETGACKIHGAKGK